MAEMKPETKIGRLIAKMGPLADWLAKNRPTVKVMRLTPDDMALLEKYRPAAFKMGIVEVGGEFRWEGYTLKKTAGVVVEREAV